MKHDREAAISARAHQLWVESGHAHGQAEQHWRQAECEHDEAETRSAAVEHFAAESVDVAPAKPIRKKAVKVAEPVVEALPRFTRRQRAPRSTSDATPLN